MRSNHDLQDRIVSGLMGHGFTLTESRAYLALCQESPATGYELAARSQVPRSAIYNVLRKLEGLGVVNAIGDKPVRYVPLEPGRLLQLFESRLTDSLTELKTSFSQLTEADADVATWNVQGYTAILQHASALIGSAKRTVHASLWAREAVELLPALRRAESAGVDVVLFSFTAIDEAPGRSFCYGIDEAELEAYWPHKALVVVDGSRLLVGGADRDDSARAVVTEEPALVEMAISNLVLDITLFGSRTGESTSEVVARLSSHLAPVDELWKGRAPRDNPKESHG